MPMCLAFQSLKQNMNLFFKPFVFLTILLISGWALADGKSRESVLMTDVQSISADSISKISLHKDAFYAALRQAYQDNPTIRAARAELHAVFEQLPQATAGWRPDFQTESSVVYNKTDSGDGGFEGISGSTDNGNTSKDVSVSVDQYLYRGGRTTAATAAARSVIQAQLANVASVEQTVLLDAARAYMDVYRDEALLRLSQNNSEVVGRQLEATEDRFDVGELTRTDVSQANARLARAEADVITARGDLRSSRATYRQVIGQESPENLSYPVVDFTLPPTLDDIVRMAEDANPNVLVSEYLHKAAEDDVDEVFGELLPELALSGSWTAAYDPQPGLLKDEKSGSLSLVASLPLYESGSTRSRVREAKHTANQRYLEILESRRKAHQEAIIAWEVLQAAHAEIRSRQAQVEASEIAQEGVRQEADVGERTILDALDADQEYLDAQVALVTAKRNEVVAEFALAATLGLLTPENLGFFEDTINYSNHLEELEDSFLGFGLDIHDQY